MFHLTDLRLVIATSTDVTVPGKFTPRGTAIGSTLLRSQPGGQPLAIEGRAAEKRLDIISSEPNDTALLLGLFFAAFPIVPEFRRSPFPTVRRPRDHDRETDKAAYCE